MNTWLNNLIKYYGIDKVNSITEYPSILTYHKLGDKGTLLNELYNENRFNKNEELEVTEKIDGTNMRLIISNSDYFIGTRSKIVYAKGDRIINDPAVEVVLKDCKYLIDSFIGDRLIDNNIYVIYGEVYGYNICDGSKVYCSVNNSEHRKFRVFDVKAFPCLKLEEILDRSIEDVSRYKDSSKDYWYDYDMLDAFCEQFQLERTPVRMRLNESELPTDLDETYKWMLDNFNESLAVIGSPVEGKDYNVRFGKSEGVVIRNKERTVISKLRFEDYERTRRKKRSA